MTSDAQHKLHVLTFEPLLGLPHHIFFSLFTYLLLHFHLYFLQMSKELLRSVRITPLFILCCPQVWNFFPEHVNRNISLPSNPSLKPPFSVRPLV